MPDSPLIAAAVLQVVRWYLAAWDHELIDGKLLNRTPPGKARQRSANPAC